MRIKLIIHINLNLSRLWERVKGREAWRAAVHVIVESDMTERLNNNIITY